MGTNTLDLANLPAAAHRLVPYGEQSSKWLLVECLLAQLTVRGSVQVSKFGLDCGDDRALRARK